VNDDTICPGGGLKTCSRCKETKPHSAFSVNKSAPDGYSYYCRECRKGFRTPENRPVNKAEIRPMSNTAELHAMKVESMFSNLVQIGSGQIANRITKQIYSDNETSPRLDAWRRSFKRSYADKLCFYPGKPEICSVAGRSALNLWTAPQAMPLPQDWQTFANIFEQHINFIVPINQRRTFKKWIADAVQHPEHRPATCYLFKGKPGTGRRLLFQMIANAIGADISAIAIVESEYETRLSKKIFASAHNVRTDTAQLNFWRRTVTEPIRKYERLSYIEKNCTRFCFLDVQPFDCGRNVHSRQLITVKTPNAADPQWLAQWLDGLNKIIGNPALAPSVRHWLATLDLSGFDHTADVSPPLPVPKPPKERKTLKPRSEAVKAWGHGYGVKRFKRTGEAGAGATVALPGDPIAPETVQSGEQIG
jgi:hypothetical protein